MPAIKPRMLSGVLGRALKTFPAVVVTGPRQSGKTTLLRRQLARTHGCQLIGRKVLQSWVPQPVGRLAAQPGESPAQS